VILSATLLQELGHGLGFAAIGASVARAPSASSIKVLEQWLERGAHADMRHMESEMWRSASPKALFPQAKTVISAALPYKSLVDSDAHERINSGRVARFAWGHDYHLIMRDRLFVLAQRLAQAMGRAFDFRVCVDSSPLLERQLAVDAGLAFIGKSTMAIIPGTGSWFVLGELLTELECEAPTSGHRQRCGDCTACIDVCPTGAIEAPFRVDASRCVSWLTIENRQSIPLGLRPGIGDMVFGCDLCQRCCPFNHSRGVSEGDSKLFGDAPLTAINLVELLEIGAAAHRRLGKGRALRRASRPQLARNAAIALGNIGSFESIPALKKAALGSIYPLVRAHALGAVALLDPATARRLATQMRSSDEDELVVTEGRGDSF